MKRIYHPYWNWEEYEAGMWRNTSGSERAELLNKAFRFTGNATAYGDAMLRVINEWPISCEHNLTDTSMNRLAWVGHAACCLMTGAPEDVTRKAWGMLTDQQRIDADKRAQEAVDEWERQHQSKGECVPKKLDQARLL